MPTLELRSQQTEVFNALKRFNVLVAHRRLGKTVLAVGILIHRAQTCKHNRPQVHYYAPSYTQAKRVAWAYVREFLHGTGTVFNESELKATTPSGAVIQLGSAENPDSSRGIYSDFVVLDEPAQMATRMWTEVLRPALSDRQGGALMIGTPQGRHGLFFESYENAADDPLWWRGMYKASETGVLPDEELQAARRAMSKAEYDQEYECSFSASIRGAYWADAMNELEDKGRLTTISHDPERLVHCSFDLGVNDATAVWFFQIDGDQVQLINYAEITNTGLPDIVRWLKKKEYNYGPMIFPHDVNVQSLATGHTRRHTLQGLGVDVIVAPKLPLIDAIDTTRSFLSRCTFDLKTCRDGIEALRQYRSDWNDKGGVLRLTPVHDWSSHGADAMRYLATTRLSSLSKTWGGKLEYDDKGIF